MTMNDQRKLLRDVLGELLLMIIHEVRIRHDDHRDRIVVDVQDSATCYEIGVRIFSDN